MKEKKQKATLSVSKECKEKMKQLPRSINFSERFENMVNEIWDNPDYV